MRGDELLYGAKLAWLEHPMVGRRRALSAVGVGYVGLTVAATLLAMVLYAGGVDHAPGWTVRLVDGYTAVLILAALLSATVLPTVYALANAGPGLAAAIGLAPFVTASALHLEYTLTTDLVVALGGAALGATVAVAVAWYRHARDQDHAVPGWGEGDGLLLASALGVVALGAAWRFDRGAPADAVATVEPLHWLAVVPLTGCVALWALFVAVSR